jgi:hypothetical protein
MIKEQELFGEQHEQEENALFGREHKEQENNCKDCGKIKERYEYGNSVYATTLENVCKCKL